MSIVWLSCILPSAPLPLPCPIELTLPSINIALVVSGFEFEDTSGLLAQDKLNTAMSIEHEVVNSLASFISKTPYNRKAGQVKRGLRILPYKIDAQRPASAAHTGD